MSEIAGPKRGADDPDREIDCQEAAEAEFQEFAERMEAAGWTAQETDTALLALAMARIKARMANRELEAAIQRATESMGEA
ncbi:MAG TPA: hypothetical protein VGN97_09910 [Mesorhizobium sp.]|jgi:2-methylisocitrate lyase-like PEP mutase family enzyme|nr:hypothetical protein [Mesorhizobium sp.]